MAVLRDHGNIAGIAERYGMRLTVVPDGEPIPGTYWGEPEAGLIGARLLARLDTPVHSLLHELAHYVCMTPERRAVLHRDAGGDHAEECAVCWLQVALARELPGVGTARLLRDMDAWGYTFREGSAARWFAGDGADARAWLLARGLIDSAGRSTFRLRE